MPNYNKMWNWIQDELVNLAEIEYGMENPGLNLVSAIIIQAAKDRDFAYLKSEAFFLHCKLLRINFVKVGYIVRSAHEIEDSGEDFRVPGTVNYSYIGYDDEDD